LSNLTPYQYISSYDVSHKMFSSFTVNEVFYNSVITFRRPFAVRHILCLLHKVCCYLRVHSLVIEKAFTFISALDSIPCAVTQVILCIFLFACSHTGVLAACFKHVGYWTKVKCNMRSIINIDCRPFAISHGLHNW
jgi:hypothetical protein